MAGRPVMVAGFGFRASATAESLVDALAQAGKRVEALATAADKADSAAFAEFSAGLGLPVIKVTATSLEAQDTATRSTASDAARGTGSVAEAAALAAAGPGARLVQPRVISGDRLATCAIAEGAGP